MTTHTRFVFSDAEKTIERLRRQGFTKFTVVRARRGRIQVRAFA